MIGGVLDYIQNAFCFSDLITHFDSFLTAVRNGDHQATLDCFGVGKFIVDVIASSMLTLLLQAC